MSHYLAYRFFVYCNVKIRIADLVRKKLSGRVEWDKLV